MTNIKPKVAIIEDDSAISSMYEFRLVDCGYDVKIANNGKEGLQLIVDYKPDVVLIDLMMPVMSGMEVLEFLKKNKGYTDAKIIVLSNMGDSETAIKIRSFEVDDHIVKVELSPGQVADRVKKVLEK